MKAGASDAAAAAGAQQVQLELSSIGKRFGGVRALAGVHLTARGGEVLALVGETGAGRSTLVKILTGIHEPDDGEIRLDGRLLSFANPLEAMRAGITAVH